MINLRYTDKVAVEGHKYIDITVSGYRTVVLLPDEYDMGKLQKALDYAYKMLCGSCYMEMVIADNFLMKAKDIFIKRKMFRFKFKKDFTDLQTNLRDTMKVYEEYMDDVYYNEYSSVLYEKVADIIEKMRKMIEDKLRNLGVKNAYDSSIAIMIQNLTQQIDDTFLNVMGKVREDYDVNLTQAYVKHRPKLAYSKADCVLYDVMHDDCDKFNKNIVNNKHIVALWSEITKRIYDQKNQIEARKEAYYNMPKEQQDLYIMNKDGFLELKEGVKVYRKEA